MQKKSKPLFERFAATITKATGKPLAFILAFLVIIAWGISGPLFGFSDTWQLVMNTISSVVTFLMVFLIQNTQNRDSAALQVKIDELIRATSSRRDLIGIEEMSGPELDSKRREIRMEDQGKSNL